MGNLGACERAQTKSRRAGNFVWMKAWLRWIIHVNKMTTPLQRAMRKVKSLIISLSVVYVYRCSIHVDTLDAVKQ